jgi:5-methylthioadenosine/S-adenosylhomocysteine deaminase
MWNTLLRSFAGDKQEESYFPMVTAIGKFWGPSDSYQGTRLGAVEALNSGITAVHNWSHMLPKPEFATPSSAPLPRLASARDSLTAGPVARRNGNTAAR